MRELVKHVVQRFKSEHTLKAWSTIGVDFTNKWLLKVDGKLVKG